MAKINVLDCTLRDGGYYTNWDFSPNLVSAYLQTAGASGIDAIEIGFRSMPQDRFLGAFAYSTDDFLSDLPLPKNVAIAVMVNAKELLAYREGAEAAVDLLFQEASQSPVRMVRIACHFAELARCRGAADRLKAKGYSVAVNLMQASGKSPAELSTAARTVDEWGSVDVLYIADSLGNMSPAGVTESLGALAKGWRGPIGVHTHDNMGQALTNCLAAIAAGSTWLDGTILGMGRGAGNVATEYLLLEIKQRGLGDYYPDAVFPLVLEYFEPLRKQHGWGRNLLYYLSGLYGIHPTYVQEMLGKGQYDIHHLLQAIEFLKDSSSHSYSDGNLERAMLGSNGRNEGTWSAEGWAKGRPFLIIAPGPGTRQHADAISRYIDRKGPVAVCINVNAQVPHGKVSAFAACHRTRLLVDGDKYRVLKRPLVCPLGMVPDVIRGKLDGVDILDYGMTVTRDTFEVGARGCTIPASLGAAYVMALAEASGASRILLAGFDGYGSSDPRHMEMADIFRAYSSRPTALPLVAVTPTGYDVRRNSIYAPDL